MRDKRLDLFWLQLASHRVLETHIAQKMRLALFSSPPPPPSSPTTTNSSSSSSRSILGHGLAARDASLLLQLL